LEWPLATEEGFTGERVDFRYLLVGYGVAAARRTIAMDHQELAGSPIRLIVGIGESGVDGEVSARIRIHQVGRNGIEALGSLPVTLLQLRPQVARPAADWVGPQQSKAPTIIDLPDFQLRFFLAAATWLSPSRARASRYCAGVIAPYSLAGASNPIGLVLTPLCTAGVVTPQAMLTHALDSKGLTRALAFAFVGFSASLVLPAAVFVLPRADLQKSQIARRQFSCCKKIRPTTADRGLSDLCRLAQASAAKIRDRRPGHRQPAPAIGDGDG
jgi:hypothetical protein